MSIAKCLTKLKINPKHEDAILAGLAASARTGKLDSHNAAVFAVSDALIEAEAERADIVAQIEAQMVDVYVKAQPEESATTGKTVADFQPLADKVNARLGGGRKVVVVQSESDLPGWASQLSDSDGNAIEGAYIGGKNAYIVADSIHTEQRFNEVVQHELHHMAGEQTIESAEYQRAINNIISMEKAGNKLINELAFEVDRRQPGLDADTRAMEIMALAAETGRYKESPMLVRLFADIVRAFKRIALKMGVKSELLESVTIEEIFSMMRAGERGLYQEGGMLQEREGAFVQAYSQNPFDGIETPKTKLGDKTEIEVDGVMRPALNSNGQPIHWSEEGVRNFWKWFKNSTVVDELGRPLVVYHGRSAGIYRPEMLTQRASELRDRAKVIEEILREKYGRDESGYRTDEWPADSRYEEMQSLYKQATDVEGDYWNRSPDLEGGAFDVSRSGDVGIHFTADPKVAGEFGKSGAVFPVYLSASSVVRVLDIFSRYQGLTAALDELRDSGVITQKEADKFYKAAERLDNKNYPDERDWGSSAGVVGFWQRLNAVLSKKENLALIYENEVEGGGDTYVVFDPTQIKSATGNIGTFNPRSANILKSESAPWYYSALAKALKTAPEKVFNQPASGLKMWIQSNAAKLGVKADELQWTGLLDWLDTQGKARVTREQVSEYLAQGGVQLRETVLGVDRTKEMQTQIDAINDRYNEIVDQYGVSVQELPAEAKSEIDELTERHDRISDEMSGYYPSDHAAKFAFKALDTLPGVQKGENYREFFLTLPDTRKSFKEWYASRLGDIKPFEDMTDAEEEFARNEYSREELQKRNMEFNSPHWPGITNPVAHLRVDTIEVDGKRYLRVNEVQSDWQSAFREGKEVPSAPFIGKDPKPTTALAIKRAIALAAQEGMDGVVFASGQESADLYDLSRQVDNLEIRPLKDGSGKLSVYADGKLVTHTAPDNLDSVVGKDMARKAVEDGVEKETVRYSGLDLKVGGEGMLKFYDEIVPQAANAVLRQVKAGVNVETIEADKPRIGFRITPEFATKVAGEGMPLFSRAPAQPTEQQAIGDIMPSGVNSYVKTMLDKAIYNFQDRFIDLRRMVKEAGDVGEKNNPDLAETRYSGMVAARVEDFHQDMRDPLIKAIHAAKLKNESAQDALDRSGRYALALHAKERNAAMREINPTQEELDDKIATLEAKRDSLSENENVLEYIKLRRDLRQAEADIEDGLADESLARVINSEITALKRTGEEINEYTESQDKLKSLRNAKPFVGDNTWLSGMKDSEAEKIVADAKADGTEPALLAISKMIDAITSKARQNLLEGGLITSSEKAAWEAKYQHYVPAHRDEVLGEFDVGTGTGQGYNIRGKESKRATGSTKEVTNIIAHVIAQYEASVIRSEKNRVDRAMYEFMKAHPSDVAVLDTADMKRVVDQTTGLVVNRVDPLFKQKPNVLTFKIDGEEHTITFDEYNPHAARLAASFKNLSASDLGEVTQMVGTLTRFLATMNTTANPVFLARNFLRDLSTAFINLSDTELAGKKAEIFKLIPKAIKGFWDMSHSNKLDSETAKYARELRDAGGQTGWMEHYKDIGTRADKLKKMVAVLGDGAGNLTKREAALWWNTVQDANGAVENGVRLATYIVARKSGMSEGKAASVAKNLTVNFNLHGAKGVELNMWYMFMNASIQGTARMVKAIGNKNVQKILMGVVASGFLMDLLARSLAGDDDDDGENDYDQLPDYTKSANFVFWVDGRPVTIPLPYGYNFFHSIGRKMGEAIFRKNYSPAKSAVDLVGIALGAFSPFGQTGSPLQFFAPTIIDPFVQVAENKNFAGNPVYKEQMPFSVPKPEAQMGFKSTSVPAKWLAELLGNMTGGNEIRPGFLNINPAILDFAITSITGGAGRTYLQAFNLPIKAAVGEDIQAREVPFVNIFASAKPENQTTGKFYENLRRIKLAEAELNNYRGNAEMTREIREDYGVELKNIKAAKLISTMIENLNKKERAATENGNKAQVKLIEERKAIYMNKLNKLMSKQQ